MMNNTQTEDNGYYESESLSEEFERDARRYNKAFTEEEEVRLI